MFSLNIIFIGHQEMSRKFLLLGLGIVEIGGLDKSSGIMLH